METIRKNQTLSALMAIAGAAGTVVTAFFVRRSAKMEFEMQKTKEKTNNKDVFELIKLYLPAIISGSITIASIIGSTLLSKKTEASLAAMTLLANQGWRKYKKELVGLGKRELKKMKSDSIESCNRDDGKKLYFEERVGLFRANPEKLALAYSDINQRIQIEDFGQTSYYAMLYNFLQAAEAELLNENIDILSLRWGWSADSLNDLYGYRWVHMQTFEGVKDNMVVTTIIWQEEPILDPGNGGEAFLGREKESHTNRFLSAIPRIIEEEEENE